MNIGDKIGNFTILGFEHKTFPSSPRKKVIFCRVFCHKYNRYGLVRKTYITSGKSTCGRRFKIKDIDELSPEEYLKQFIPHKNKNDYWHLHYQPLGKTAKWHQVVWYAWTGEWPEFEIDHIDNDKRNNHISNLQHFSRSQNMQKEWDRRKNNFNSKGKIICRA